MKDKMIILCSILIIILGIIIGYIIFSRNNKTENKNIIEIPTENVVKSIEINSEEEKTTPNTLITYKIYYTKCKHYISKYEDIDVSLVNLNEEEFAEKNKEWKVEKFSKEEIILTKEEEKFCNQHYKLKLENDNINIYTVDENGKETLYENTNISYEYLTKEDIERLELRNNNIWKRKFNKCNRRL